MVQQLRLCAPTAGGASSIPGGGTKISHAAQCGKTQKPKKNMIFWKRQYYGDGKKITGCQRFGGKGGINRWNTELF